jgi:MutS domain V
MEPTDPIERIYARRAARFDRRAKELLGRSQWISYARLGVFLLAAACILAAVVGATLNTLFFALGVCLAGGFVFLVVRHRAVSAAEERYRRLATINEHALARVRRDWAKLPAPSIVAEPNDPAIAHDLDLFGRASLVQLLGGGGATAQGRRMLRAWLLEPATPEAIAARQRAVAEMAGQLNRRQRFIELGGRLGNDAGPTERFLAWADDRGWLAQRAWLRWTARLAPVALVASAAAQYVGLLPISLWVIVLLFNVALSLLLARTVHGIFNRVSTRAGEIAHYAGLFTLVSSRPAQAERLRQLEEDMNHRGHGATAQLNRLARLVSLADLRLSHLVHGVVQALTMWDFHVLDAIERWQARSRLHARCWFAALAEWDALATLAGLAHDNPTWAYAEIGDPGDEAIVAARGLGHPLLAASVRVCNDVALGPPGTFLLVTGSNMSGKSTLLRAIGVNAVLAQAGGAVAAESFRIPPLEVATSMRIEDSLADGTSVFMAELKRLKQIVDAACRWQAAGHQRRLLYLLDEILHGTNSVERQIAVRRVMLHLLQQGAIGAISTHDLALADVAPLDTARQAVHFQESICDTPAGRRMTFDYKLRAGLATTTNALALLEMVGLVPPDGAEDPTSRGDSRRS